MGFRSKQQSCSVLGKTTATGENEDEAALSTSVAQTKREATMPVAAEADDGCLSKVEAQRFDGYLPAVVEVKTSGALMRAQQSQRRRSVVVRKQPLQ